MKFDETMKPKIILCLALVLSGVLFDRSTLYATISGMNQLQVDFTRLEDATNKATWAKPDKLGVTTNGLGWDGEAASLYEGWIQTKPLAVGLSWRPPGSVTVRVTIKPAPKAITLNSGQIYTPYSGQVFARYSPDFKHWSSWQVLQPDKSSTSPDSRTRTFSGELAVPEREREQYDQYMAEYSKLDVPWISDEEALANWILQCDPTFFEHSLPFIGYVECLFEDEFYGGQRITVFKAEITYNVSGIAQSSPKTKNIIDGGRDDLPWRFKSTTAQSSEKPEQWHGFPILPPITNANPSIRLPFLIHVPTELKIERTTVERTTDMLSVEINRSSLEATNLMVGTNMVTGVESILYIYPEGEPRPANGGYGLGGTDFNLGTIFRHTKQEGIPLPGKKYVVELDLIVFETDIPSQHMWRPQGSKIYKVLWRRTLKQTVE
jgi:hypothetical protein